MGRARKAVNCFKAGFNCAQALLSTYAEEFALDRDLALKIACGLGAGMGRMSKTCGAVTGAFLVIGLKHGKGERGDNDAKEKTYKLVREFTHKFEARHGSVECTDLLGCDISSAEGLALARETDLFEIRCTVLLESSAQILEEIL
jgi:C_GCAxxG_C_C family probable redox protein